ncbi:hypothetical protein D3C85_1323660 [compost metagenome]
MSQSPLPRIEQVMHARMRLHIFRCRFSVPKNGCSGRLRHDGADGLGGGVPVPDRAEPCPPLAFAQDGPYPLHDARILVAQHTRRLDFLSGVVLQAQGAEMRQQRCEVT